ncbi:sigma-70 family RNA polymerase sigma factor [Streptomyces sp. AC627_RSS907]|uniref:sigma-70 family RNA polymerase sigma factor n=1 Tax=Streptomyces sp. AC627_RSS907 TaxID=2823684 RepID=UPI001C2489CB|nr:sigma-70 family RNA polymerase sigma factor [Streptomyces sp. AC627_RSS907]
MPRLARPTQGKYADFARSVRALREAAGMSVQELSEASQVPPSSIYAAESGTRLPSEENFAAMARALGTDAERAAEMRRSAQRKALHDQSPQDDNGSGPGAFAHVRSAQELSGLLRALHVRAGSPSLRRIARAAHASPSAVSRFLNGHLPTDLQLLNAFLDALGTTDEEHEAVSALWRQRRRGRISRPNQQTLALLYGSATSCAYPGCTVPLITWDGDQPRNAVEIVHIESYSSTSYADLDHFDNLILLCPNHHRRSHSASPTELKAWKADQTARVRAAAPAQPSADTAPPAPDLALQAFFQAHKESFYGFARFYLGSPEGDEVTQDAFKEMAAAWNELMAQENLEGAAFNILRRHVQGALRRNGHAQAFIIEVPEEFRHQPGGVELPESALTEFRAALIELPERQRDVIVLRHLLGYSTEQTARCMGLSQDAVRFHDAKGRRRLDQYSSPS